MRAGVHRRRKLPGEPLRHGAGPARLASALALLVLALPAQAQWSTEQIASWSFPAPAGPGVLAQHPGGASGSAWLGALTSEAGQPAQLRLLRLHAAGHSSIDTSWSWPVAVSAAGELQLIVRSDGGLTAGFSAEVDTGAGSQRRLALAFADSFATAPNLVYPDPGINAELEQLVASGTSGDLLAALSLSGSDSTAWLIALNEAGLVSWSDSLPPALGPSLEGALAVSATGKIAWLAAHRPASGPPAIDLRLQLYDTLGSLQWGQSIHVDDGQQPLAPLFASGDTLLVAGSISVGTPALLLRRFSPDGLALGGSEPEMAALPSRVALRSTGGLAAISALDGLLLSESGLVEQNLPTGGTALVADPGGGVTMAGASLRRYGPEGFLWWEHTLPWSSSALARLDDSTLIAAGHDADAPGGPALRAVLLRESFHNRPPTAPELLAPPDLASVGGDSLASVTLRWSRSLDPDPGAEPQHQLSLVFARHSGGDTLLQLDLPGDSSRSLGQIAAATGLTLSNIHQISWSVSASSQGDTVYAANSRTLLVETLRVRSAELLPEPPRLKLWPNPGNGRITIQLHNPRAEAHWLEVYNLLGRRVLRRNLGNLAPGNNTLSLDLPLASGSYWMCLVQENGERADFGWHRLVLLR